MNLLNPYWARKRVAELDAEKDYREIAHLSFEVRYATPIFTHALFSVAFARQAAVPSIAKVLYRGGKGGIITNPYKRNNDTLLFFGEFFKHGDTGPGLEAVQLLNFIHSHFPITNEQNLYTIATLMCEPIRMSYFLTGKSMFTPKEERAAFLFWRRMGELMGITNMPEDEKKMYEWYIRFEQENFAYSMEGEAVVKSLADEFAARWYPSFMKKMGVQVYHSLFDDLLRNALNVKKAPFLPRESVRAFLWFQLVVLAKILPDPDDRSIIDYYKGDYKDYHISKVGPFTGRHSGTEKPNAH
ncbi:MAG: oxygenase MpaB family protein [Chitinophagales bacterium]